MDFNVFRTSLWTNEKSCEEAKKQKKGKWILKIKTLKELLFFCDNHGPIIISKDKDGSYSVEILTIGGKNDC